VTRLPILQAEPQAPVLPHVSPTLGGQKRIWVDTYGCQMNEHDTQRMIGLMAEEGYLPTPDMDLADLLIINSCSVREKAENKLRSAAGRLKHVKKARPGAVIALAGCVAQQEGASLLTRVPHADLVLGPDHVTRLPELVRRIQNDRVRLNETTFVERDDYVFPRLTEAAPVETIAYVSIMKGCDKFCSFCIVPMTRGRESCRDAEEIVREVQSLAARGTKEVVLLGQTVNTYGARKVHGEIPFHELIARIADVDGIERIRFTSPHPADFSDAQIRAFRDVPKLCPHMHLPVQSGSTRVLQAMRRGYTREDYIALVDRFREMAPNAALSTDIIVGFPSETEAEFEETLSLMEHVRFDQAYSFAYSERTGTRAATLEEGVVPLEDRRRRLATLQALQDRHTQARLQSMVGRRYSVLVEGVSKSNPNRSSGRTDTNRVVHMEGQLSPGIVVTVDIIEAYAHSVLAVLAPPALAY